MNGFFTSYKILQLIFWLWLLVGFPIDLASQEINPYDALYEQIETTDDEILRNSYLNSYLHLAKEEKNAFEIYQGYSNFIYFLDNEQLNPYLDSMNWAAYQTRDPRIIGESYLRTGIQYYKKKNYSEALTYYGMAKPYIDSTNDSYMHHKLLYSLAQVYYVLGFLDDAIALFEQCRLYFKGENLDGYLNSVHGLASSYTRLGKYSKSSELIHQGLEVGIRNSEPRMDVYFYLLQGINHFHENRLDTSLRLLSKTVDVVAAKGDFSNAQLGYFYLGKIHKNLEDRHQSKNYYKKVDSLFVTYGFIRPDLREVYDFLIDHSLFEQKLEDRLYYMNQRMKADKMFEGMYVQIFPKLFQDPVHSELGFKESNTTNNITFIGFRIVLGIGIVLLVVKYHSLIWGNLKALLLTPELIEKNSLPESEPPKLKNDSAVPMDSLRLLLPKLQKFEREKKYLERDWKQAELAVYLKSNVLYVKMMIKEYRTKNYSQYIHDLKIDYLVEMMKTEPKFRHYTNKALAKELGFSSTEKMVKAFKSKMGKSILDYINELDQT